jgi:hypothetical protein
MPKTEADVLTVPKDGFGNYGNYLRITSSLAVDTEVNVQLGEFTLKKHRVEPVSEEMCSFGDFVNVFGEQMANSGAITCAEVKNTTARKWVRLVGRRHDLRLWHPDQRQIQSPYRRRFPGDLAASEHWLLDAMQPLLRTCGGNIQVYVQDKRGSGDYLQLAVIIPPSEDDLDCGPCMKEVVAFRSPSVVHVYDVLEHGRRYHRTLVYSSDPGRCLHQMPPMYGTAQERFGSVMIHHGTRPRKSLVITRNLNQETGLQTFIPSRFLMGLVPEALLDQYMFWQNADESISGYQYPSSEAAEADLSKLHIVLSKTGEGSKGAFMGLDASAVIKRVPLVKIISEEGKEDGSTSSYSHNDGLMGIGANTVVDKDAKVHTLVSLLQASAGGLAGSVRKLCDILLRLDNLSHVMAWTSSTVESKGTRGVRVDLVELPRLGLTFHSVDDKILAGKSTNVVTRLYCADHAGLFVSDSAIACQRTQKLLTGLPHCVVLERRDDAALFVLLPANAQPLVRAQQGTGGFSSLRLDLDRTNESWLDNISDGTRHYLYPIHPSRSFLFTPSLASALYLLLLRYINCQYDEVFRLADFCVCDEKLSNEQQQIFDHIVAVGSIDNHTDSIACRLKLMLVISGTPMSESCPWKARQEMTLYLSRVQHVSGECRLTRDEEIIVLLLCGTDQLPTMLCNRLNFLYKLRASLEDPELLHQKFSVNVLTPEPPKIYDFDKIIDKSCMSLNESVFKKLGAISYSRPKDEHLNGTTVIGKLN